MTHTRHRFLLVNTGAVVVLLAGGAAINLLSGKGCTLAESAVEEMRVLISSLNNYYYMNNTFPGSLAALGPPPLGQEAGREYSGMIDRQLASGNKLGYVFRYVPKRDPRDGRSIEGYWLTSDPITEGPRQHHYFADETGVLRSEKSRPASADSPVTHDSSCSCAAPEDYVGPRF